MACIRAGSATRSLLASLASLALLAQMLFAAPLAARMLSDLPLCAAAAGSTDHPPSPASPHTHELCLICHGGAVPLAVLAVGLALPALSVRPWHRRLAYGAALRWHAQHWPYRSRAPPALA